MYGDSGIEEERSKLFEHPKLMQVVDVLRLGGEVCQLLGEFNLRLLELIEGCLKSLHKSYTII